MCRWVCRWVGGYFTHSEDSNIAVLTTTNEILFLPYGSFDFLWNCDLHPYNMKSFAHPNKVPIYFLVVLEENYINGYLI